MMEKNVTTLQRSTLTHTLAYVSSFTGVPDKDILSRSKVDYIVNARQIVAFLLNREEKFSAGLTGRLLNLDHTSILHAVKQAEYTIKTNPTLKTLVDNYILAKPEQFFINIAKIDDKIDLTYYHNIPDSKYDLLLETIQNTIKQFQGLR